MAILILLTAALPAQAQTAASQEDTRTPTTGQQAASSAGQDKPARGPIHMVPYGPPHTLKAHPGQSNGGTVQYWGGPVISNVHVVEVLWGNFVDAPSTGGLSQFFTDITNSNYFGLLAEYSTTGLTEFGTPTPGSNQTIGSGVFDSKVTITPSVCPGSATNPICNINDTQIQTELTTQVNAGHLPQPVLDNQGNFNTIYMVYFPPGVNINVQGTPSCVIGGFCAYHSNVVSGLKPGFPYGVFPDFGPTSGCAKGCGQGTSFQNLTSASSHELGEAVTDVDVGSATAFAPPLAWADDISGQEIGDFCENPFFNDVTVTAGGTTYTVQQLWSNMQNACVSAPAHLQVTAPTTVIPGRPFNLTVTAQSSLNNSQLPLYSDTVHFTSSDGSSVLPADYAFVFGDSGAHTFSVTLNSLGIQTVNVADTLVPGVIGNGSVDVEHNPDLIIASAHNGTFKQGDTGDTYTVTVTNTGDKVTDGSTVTVTDFLPFGLTATAIGGSGWSCSTPPTLTCTRTDVLAASASYPAITVTVNVSFTANAQVTNMVQVSGGGEANTTNDTASDNTAIIQFADLVVAKFHSGVFAQGQTGQTYTISVTNVGQVFTAGTVTVTDTLPTGLTATAISGAGWTCSTPPTLSCTRFDPLGPFSQAYPPITLTVNVDATAPMPTVTNTVAVSGGGEVNTANDTASDVTTITSPAPDLTITTSHSGTFAQGQAGGTITFTVSNVGSASTSGTVTARDGLAVGLTATSISGTGWTCDLPTLACTRSDALAVNSAYPPITVQVSVNPTSPLITSNLVNTFGGSELNTVNDMATDVINITPAPDLMLFVNAPGMSQGQTGVVITSTAENLTGGTTSGTVTVTQTLPTGFTATALAGTGWTCVLNTLTCTRSDSLGPFGSYPAISLTVNIAVNAPQAFQMNMTIAGGGEANTGNDTSSVSGTLGTPITINPVVGLVTVSPGSPANFQLNVFSVVTGTITFSCGSLPAGTACNFNPASFNPAPSTSPVFTPLALTITTSGPTLASVRPWTGLRTNFLASFVFPLLALAIVAGTSRSRLRGRRLLMCLAGGVIVCLLAGCGGSSNHGPPPVVTPPGTYVITVTANNATVNTQTTSTVTLVVR